jgi:methionine synthase I (cobalamin-dependent)
MAEQARGLLAAGVAIIGGCCGTTPAHVRALRGIVSVMRS